MCSKSDDGTKTFTNFEFQGTMADQLLLLQFRNKDRFQNCSLVLLCAACLLGLALLMTFFDSTVYV